MFDDIWGDSRQYLGWLLTVHEGHIGHYQHWKTDDSSSSCFRAILNVGKMWGVSPESPRPTLYVRDYNNGGDASREELSQILQGVTPNIARSHPKYCEESPQILRGVTPNIARSHPKYCEESPQILRGVTPNIARSHPNHCEELATL